MDAEMGEQLGTGQPEQSQDQFTEQEKEAIQLITRIALANLSEYGFEKQIVYRRRVWDVSPSILVPEIMLVNESEGNAFSICLLEERICLRQGFVSRKNTGIDYDRFDHKCTWISPPPEEQPIHDVTVSWWYKEYPELDKENFYDHVFNYAKDNLAGWEGKIDEIEEIVVTKEEGGKIYQETVVYAMIELSDGAVRRENFREFSGWKVGVQLRRKRGCALIETVRKKRTS